MPYVPETCRAKNTSIKLPRCVKLAFHFTSVSISLGSHAQYMPPSITTFFIWSNKYHHVMSPTQDISDSVFLAPLPLGCTICLDTLFPKTLNLCSFLNVSGQYLHPYKISGNIASLYNLILNSEVANRKTEW